MAISQTTPPLMTVDEFHAWPGDGTPTKYELVDGELRAMAPASLTHGTIQANLARHLGNQLDAAPCRVITEAGVRPHFDAVHNERIPELVITCEPPVPGARTAEKPVAIIQVLSPSNRNDSRESAVACSTIPSVTEIVLIESETIAIEVLRRDENGHWPREPERLALDDTLVFESVDAHVPLRQIYQKTGLIEAQGRNDDTAS